MKYPGACLAYAVLFWTLAGFQCALVVTGSSKLPAVNITVCGFNVGVAFACLAYYVRRR